MIMKSTLRKIICILTLAAAFSGCAGLQDNESTPRAALLPETVPESFHFNVQDAETRQYLTTTHPDALPPEQRLEVIVLRELAKASSEKELSLVFDRLWEGHVEIKGLVHRPEQREAFIFPLVEIYYLLSAAPGQIWQEETAERLYRETLSRLDPTQLSGYALHFYTLSLLKKGKLDAAMPFLLRLERFTLPSIYLEDLTVALNYALGRGEDRIASQLMAAICRTGARDHLEISDDVLKSALLAFQRAGKLHRVREALLPLLRAYPQIERYAFLSILKEPENIARIPKTIEHQATVKAAKSQGTSAELNVGPGKVRVEIQVIKAGRRSHFMDPALAPIGKGLKETLNFTSFTLIDNKTWYLGTGETGELPLDRSHILRITARSITPAVCRADLTVFEGEREVFHTRVESVDGGSTIIAGPQAGDALLLLRITTFFTDMNACGRYLPMLGENKQKIL